MATATAATAATTTTINNKKEKTKHHANNIWQDWQSICLLPTGPSVYKRVNEKEIHARESTSKHTAVMVVVAVVVSMEVLVAAS